MFQTMRKHVGQVIVIILSPVMELNTPNIFLAVDRVFRLASWLMVVAALHALQKKSGSIELQGAVVILRSLWALGVIATFYQVINIAGNKIDEYYPYARTNRFGWFAVVGLFASGCYWGLNSVVMPLTTTMFEAVFKAVGNP